MTEAQASTATKSRKRSYVALAENVDASAEEANLVVVGNCISANAIRRSGLLSGIDSTEGLASLPSQLSPEDVKLWETSYLVDIELPLDELVTVLKVADALSDRNDSAWVKKLADLAFTAEWTDARQSNTMLSSLLRLPPHLLHRVLSTCLSTHSLSDALVSLPPPLHPATVAAAAAQCPLSIHHHTAATVLSLLPTTDVPAPGLQQLDIKDNHHSGTPCACSPSATGALLARAASAHPSLTSLSLGNLPLPPQWLRCFSSCLPPGALPALVSLTICADAHPGGCAEVAASLARLPALTTLNITLHHAPEVASAAESLSSYTRLAAAAATLPDLQGLTLCEGKTRPAQQGGLFTVYTKRPSCAHSLLSILNSSALQYLDLKLMTARVPAPALVSQILCCTAIEELHISAAVRISDIEEAKFGGTAFELPALRVLTVESNCFASLPTIASAFAELATTSLTSLELTKPEVICQPYDSVCSEAGVAESWGAFFRVLRRGTRLQVLELKHLLNLPEAARADFSRDFAAALVQLTELKQLRLQGKCVGLDGEVLGGAVATLTSLQTLGFESGGELTLELGTFFDSMQPVVDACCQLGRVTDLDLCVYGVTGAQVTAVLSGMPELSHLQLWENIFPEPAEAAVQALQSQFPSVFIEAH